MAVKRGGGLDLNGQSPLNNMEIIYRRPFTLLTTLILNSRSDAIDAIGADKYLRARVTSLGNYRLLPTQY